MANNGDELARDEQRAIAVLRETLGAVDLIAPNTRAAIEAELARKPRRSSKGLPNKHRARGLSDAARAHDRT